MAVGVATALASRFFVLVRLVVVPLLREWSRGCVVVVLFLLRALIGARRQPLRRRRSIPREEVDEGRRRRGRKIAGVARASDVERRRAAPATPRGGGVRERDAHVAKTTPPRVVSFATRRARRLRVQRLGANVRCTRAAKAFQRVHRVARRRRRGSPLPRAIVQSHLHVHHERARHRDRFLVSSRRVPNGLVLRRRNPGDGIDGAATEPDHHHAGRIDARATRHAANELGRHRARDGGVRLRSRDGGVGRLRETERRRQDAGLAASPRIPIVLRRKGIQNATEVTVRILVFVERPRLFRGGGGGGVRPHPRDERVQRPFSRVVVVLEGVRRGNRRGRRRIRTVTFRTRNAFRAANSRTRNVVVAVARDSAAVARDSAAVARDSAAVAFSVARGTRKESRGNARRPA